MNIRIIVSLAIIASLIACQPKVENFQEIIFLDTHEAIKTKKDLKLSDIAKSVEFVKLETTSECLISGGLFVVGKKYIVVLNQRPEKVMLFNRSGKYIREIGRVGQGPGEFERPRYIDLSPTEDRILVESVSYPNILYEFSISGDFIRSAEMLYRSENGVKYLDDDKFIFMQGRYISDSVDYPRVVVLDADLSNPTTLYTIDNKCNPDGRAGYYTQSLFSRLKSGYNFKDPMYDTIYYIGKNLKPVPKYVIVEGDNTAPYYTMTREEAESSQDDVDVAYELNEYLLLKGQVNGNREHLVYNKINGDFFSIKKQSKCLGENLNPFGLVNDMTGLKPYWIRESADMRNNTLQDMLNIVDLKDIIETECFNDDERLISTEYRNELKRLIESSEIDDNPIIQIIHLK